LDEPRKREDESLKLSAVKRELKKLLAEREREREILVYVSIYTEIKAPELKGKLILIIILQRFSYLFPFFFGESSFFIFKYIFLN
jgi:hypothetical protein